MKDTLLRRIQEFEDRHSFGVVGTFYFDFASQTAYPDLSLCRMYEVEYRPGGMTLQELQQNIHPEDLLTVVQQRAGQIRNQSDYELEYRLVRKSGEINWMLVRAKLVAEGDQKHYEGIVIDITDRKRTEKALKDGEERLNLAVENAGVGVFETNFRTRRIVRSAKHIELYGDDRDQKVWTIDDIYAKMPREDLKAFSNAFERQAPLGALNTTFRIKRGDGEIRWLQVIGKIGNDEFGEPLRMIGTTSDITERKIIERQKDEFISTVSHELKTPTTSIKASIQMIFRGVKSLLDSKTTPLFERMEKQIYRMEYLINQLIDVTRVESGKIPFKREVFQLHVLVEDLIAELQNVHRTHTFRIDQNQEINVYADRERITQVITNLVNNAVKYSPYHTEVVESLYIKNCKAVLEVRDQGKGIPEEQGHNLFVRFGQIAKSDMSMGLGLGLYISKEIVTQEGGEIWYESETGQGSTFCFSLPLRDGVQLGIPIRRD